MTDNDRKTVGEIDAQTVYVQHAPLATKDKMAHTSTDCPRFKGDPEEDARDTAVLHDDHMVCKRCLGDMWHQNDDDDQKPDMAGNKYTKKWRGAGLEG